MSKFATAFSSMITMTSTGGSASLDRGISRALGGRGTRAANDSKHTPSLSSGAHYKL